MQTRVFQYIQKNKLFNKDDTIVVAVSGGVDSICLLHILHSLNYNVVLAHVNHHKRVESLLEEKEMEKLAAAYQIPYECYHYYDSGDSNFHDAAHNARYQFFKTVADKYNTKLIATAHHLDDQAETILIRLMSGSNLFGYGGISKKLYEDGYTIVRPLLCVAKEEIISYANLNSLQYYNDSSNEENVYLRNRIRHNIMPILKQENPNILHKFAEFSIQCKEAFHYIRNQSINYLNKTNNTIELISFKDLDEALKKDIICLLFERYHLEKNNDIILNCLDLLNSSNGTKQIALKNNYFFIVSYNQAKISRLNIKRDSSAVLSLNDKVFFNEKYYFYFSKKITQNNVKYIKLCYNDLKLPFLIRNKQDGDFIKMSYGNKKVSRILIDSKVPTNERNNCPLVYDALGNLLWVVPYAKNYEVASQKEIGDIYLVCEEKENEE